MNLKSDEYWKQKLSSEQYNILRNKATEPPFSGEYVDHNENGMYACVACGQELFSSETKFNSKSGWPSFYDIAKEGTVKLLEDTSLGMKRTEVICSNCEGHLGHVFEDAHNQPTGLRYCINSKSLQFKKASENK